jgi:hypothetical protein
MKTYQDRSVFRQIKQLTPGGNNFIHKSIMTKAAGTKDKKKKKKKKTALVICSDRKQFWTTQAQFWQWAREGVVTKTHDSPLTGTFKREHEELLVLLSNTVLNLAHPNHMREALLSRRVGLARK